MSQIAFQQNAALRMTTTRTYDNLNRLISIGSSNAARSFLDSHAYGYNNANQRTSMTNGDGCYWMYQYDGLGQVTSGVKYWSDGTPVAGQRFGYGFDDIGNRLTTTAGGDQLGGNLRSASYSPNNLNQYTSRTVPGAVEVMGTLTTSANVLVNNNPAYRKGTYYRVALTAPNSSGPVYQSITNLAALPGNPDVFTNTTGNSFVPQTPENFSYDADGNLTGDGRWMYTWDAENRLVGLTNNSNIPSTARMKLIFGYDWKGRRVSKTVSNYVGSAYQLASQTTFAYDGWNLLTEMSATNNILLRSYIWGLDMSGSPQGAGGIGGLLGIRQNSPNSQQFVAYDGNGNASLLTDAATSAVVGQYEYGPFGELLRATGPMAKASLFRFSTKYIDDETDLVYYGYRYYNASTGRWITRDPLAETGGINHYEFVGNNPENATDRDGRKMHLTEHFYHLSSPPYSGDYAGYLGLTWFKQFDPQARVYLSPDAHCCWKIVFTGLADLWSWWVEGTFALDGTSSRDHEMMHVACDEATFHGYDNSGSAYENTCFSKAKADCLRRVIVGPMFNAFAESMNTGNMEIDCQGYGLKCDKIAAQIQKEQSAWDALARALQACDTLP